MTHYDNVALKLRERTQTGPDEERRRRGAAQAAQPSSVPPPPPMMPPPAAPAQAPTQTPASTRDSDSGKIVASMMASLIIPTGVNAAKVLAFVQDKVLSGPARDSDSSEFFTWFATLAGSAREYITSADAWDMSEGAQHSTSGSEEAASSSIGKFPMRPPASSDRAMRSTQFVTNRTGKQAD